MHVLGSVQLRQSRSFGFHQLPAGCTLPCLAALQQDLHLSSGPALSGRMHFFWLLRGFSF